MAKLYKTDGTVVDVPIPKGTMNKLTALQNLVGGFIEIVEHIHPGRVVIVNEDGLVLGLPPNPFKFKKRYVGDVVVAKVPEEIC